MIRLFLNKLATTMVGFDPRFEILSGTNDKETVPTKAGSYEAVTCKPVVEYNFRTGEGQGIVGAPPLLVTLVIGDVSWSSYFP